MTFFCDSCSQDRDFYTDYGILIIDAKNRLKRICRICRKPKAVLFDVYWDGKPEENLENDPNTGNPRVFNSKSEKAAYLKEKGIREAGDPVHGAPFSTQNVPRGTNLQRESYSRDEVRKALWQVKQMGRDVRRQAYLKIIKEGRRYA